MIRFARFALALLVVCGCSRTGGDEYLSSLKLAEEPISPVDIVDISSSDLLQPTGIVKFGDWLALTDNQGGRLLYLLNLSDGTSIRVISRGRGPGEMLSVNASSSGDRLILYDPTASRTLVSLDVGESLLHDRAIFDTIAVFKSSNVFPINLNSYGGGIVASLAGRKNVWYASVGLDGEVKSRIPEPGYDVLRNMDENLYYSFLSSSHFTLSPDGKRACCTMSCAAAMSFAEIGDGGILREYRRYEYNPPEIVRRGELSAFSKDRKVCFSTPASDEDAVYVLYSGKSLVGEGESPSYERSHLIVYDWDGNPLRHCRLSESAMSICVGGGKAYCLSTWPETRVLVYSIGNGKSDPNQEHCLAH
jgi:hypothetical protein